MAIDPTTLLDLAADRLGANQVRAFEASDSLTFESIFGPRAASATVPLGVITPTDTAQLQAAVRFAGAQSCSLWRVMSPGAAGARAGNASQPGLLLDLSALDRVVAIDADSATARLEPGVTFEALAAHLEAQHLPFWIDADRNGRNSVVGSICDRGWGYTPYGDHLLMQCGFEIVDGRGALLRTGMGALPESRTWQLFKYNYGPYVDGLYSRGDFGVVSQAGLWIMPPPPAWHPFMVTLPDESALATAVEILRPLRLDLTIPNTVAISHIDAEAALVELTAPASSPDFIAMLQAGTIGRWNLYGALYGLPDNIDAAWELVSARLGTLPGARIFSDADQRDDAVWQARRTLMRGKPAYLRDAVSEPARLWFAASAAPDAKDVEALLKITSETLDGLEPRLSFALAQRALFLEVDLSFDSTDYADKRDRMRRAAKRLASAGFAVSHDCADLHADIAAAQTAPALLSLYAELARELDPYQVFAGH